MYKYYCNCVNWPRKDVAEGLTVMIEKGIDITRKTFKKYVDKEALILLEEQLGYERDSRRGLTMSKDWHVSYHKSFLHGETCYYITHSAIEFVFKKG